MPARPGHAPGGATNLWFDQHANVLPEARDSLRELLGQVVHVDHELAHARRVQGGKRVLQNRAVADRHERLRQLVSQRPEARAKAGA